MDPAHRPEHDESRARGESRRGPPGFRGEARTASTEGRIGDLAARQQGIVSRGQLVAAGVPGHAIDDRLRTGRLVGVYRGVYRVGPVEAPYAREMAAVLACGMGAVLSHQSAGRLLGLPGLEAKLWPMAGRNPGSRGSTTGRREGRGPGPGAEASLHVTVPASHRAPGPGVTVHRTSGLEADERTTLHGVPATVPARTLLDLAGVLAPRRLERLVAAAFREGATDAGRLGRLVGRYPHRRGAGVVRDLLARESDLAFTRSAAEERFLDLLRRGGLPAPRTNARLAGLEVDFHWPAARLVVEIDGYAFHRSRAAFERDHRRDATLLGAGVRLRRFTWRQLTRDPARVLVAVTRALYGPGP